MCSSDLDPKSFSVPHFHDKVIEYLDPESTEGGKLTREEAYFTNQQLGKIHSLPRGAAFESPVAKDEDYADGRVAREAIKRLQAAKDRTDTPFFMAVGYVRPHLSINAPKKYWDLHEPLPPPHPQFGHHPAEDFPHWEPAHKVLMGNGIPGLENIGGDLDAVTGKRCTFAAFPWRWTEGDGCGVRVVAIVDPDGSYRISQDDST